MLMPGVNRALFTLLSDVAEALLLNGLVIYEALHFGGGAVHIRVLEGGKKAQDSHKIEVTPKELQQIIENLILQFRQQESAVCQL